MATVNKTLADKLKANNGYYSDDTRVIRVVEYDNAWGGVAYGLEYEGQLGRYAASEYVRNPRVYFEVT